MTLNEYCAYLSSTKERSRKSRLLIVPSQKDRQRIREFYRQRQDVSVIRVSDAILTNAFLPMPSLVWHDIQEQVCQINKIEKQAFIIGLDGYWQLLAPDKTWEMQGVLRSLLDDVSLSVVLIMESLDTRRPGSPLAYPRYREECSIIAIGEGEPEPSFAGEVTLVRREFLSSGQFTRQSIQQFLGAIEDDVLEHHQVGILVDSAYEVIPGVNPAIRQVLTLKSYLKVFWNFDEVVSDDLRQWLYNVLRGGDSSGSVLSILQNRFYPKGMQDYTVTAPRKINGMCGGEQEAFVWMLRKTVSHDTYLYHVLNNESVAISRFRSLYVSSALGLLHSPRAELFAEERRKAIKEIGCENVGPALKEFVGQCRSLPTREVAPWLNNGTKIEKQEILRRVIKDQGEEVLPAVRKSYPLLDAYLQRYMLGHDAVNEYFTIYRTQKLKNTVTIEFFHRSAQETIPPDIIPRDELVQRYSSDPKTGLLVVDALGVEYLPMILALAQARDTGVETVMIGSAKLPTSTRFNRISWEDTRRLQDVKRLDNIVHNGAEAHEMKSVEENLFASLEAIERNVLPAVEDGLMQYDRIVLTSDHGASRLAVCAYEKGYTRTLELPVEADVMDWRYSSAVSSAHCPESMVASLCGGYWAVKGYNRLAKQGGKRYEVHGGATLEEWLVPIIVFVKGAVFVPKPQGPSCKSGDQLTVNEDFDL